LLHLAAAWTRAAGRRLLALTVDHGLSDQSAEWTIFAGDAANRAGADWRALAWIGQKPVTGLPAAARAARHRLLAEAARSAGAKVILFAHTADDVAESDLMRTRDAPTIGRLREWSPSPVWPDGCDLFVLRPLLGVRRQALRAALAQRGSAWIEDPANGDLRFARPRARASLAALGADLAVDDPAQGFQPTAALTDLALKVDIGADGRLTLPRPAVDADPWAVTRLVSILTVCAGGGERPPRSAAIARLYARLEGGEAFAATLAGARIIAGERDIVFARDAGELRRKSAPGLVLAAGERAVWDGRFEIVADTQLRVTPVAGFAARLAAGDRAQLWASRSEARQALPLLWPGEAPPGEGSPGLPRPFSGGPATARALAKGRMAAAAGLTSCEREIVSAGDSCKEAMAQALHSSYVDTQALA
jgi:tRNA(Ile)-lysidine synthase